MCLSGMTEKVSFVFSLPSGSILAYSVANGSFFRGTISAQQNVRRFACLSGSSASLRIGSEASSYRVGKRF